MGKNILLWLVIGITMVSLFNMFNPPLKPGEGMSYSSFVEKVDGGMVETARIKGHEISEESKIVNLDLVASYIYFCKKILFIINL